jgi:hypothetical protein
MAKPNAFDIPKLYYFESRNTFTGSRGDFNFKIVPSDTLQVTVWHGFLCSELAQVEAENHFPLTEDGFAEMLRWLEEAYCGRV